MKSLIRREYNRAGAETDDGVIVYSTVEHGCLQCEQNCLVYDDDECSATLALVKHVLFRLHNGASIT